MAAVARQRVGVRRIGDRLDRAEQMRPASKLRSSRTPASASGRALQVAAAPASPPPLRSPSWPASTDTLASDGTSGAGDINLPRLSPWRSMVITNLEEGRECNGVKPLNNFAEVDPWPAWAYKPQTISLLLIGTFFLICQLGITNQLVKSCVTRTRTHEIFHRCIPK